MTIRGWHTIERVKGIEENHYAAYHPDSAEIQVTFCGLRFVAADVLKREGSAVCRRCMQAQMFKTN